MKISKITAFALSVLLLSTIACENSTIELESHLKQSSSKLHINADWKQVNNKPAFVIYDYSEATSGLQKLQVELQESSGNPKVDIIKAFLTHNHIINEANQVQLLRIEENGTNTHYYLTSSTDLANPSTQKLFNEALELTLMRHLKNNNFNIFFNETAQL